ncbi:ATP-binding cassette domain-containing protein [Luteolibacter sp. GHJ8]|uniref:ATP-binding cassette domain-containing protein n=1 Tax=Luteolibacter rhizosphaerae TaxID=2989719 RepID=A0ABT3GBC2_9BACT|nr:ATP-binding cassette domain-containing protein [Luteolibacter rhizosphaerae]MCW1917085.1 ATP-binding cassette domain-containing protein [Luteolibacter rhizosphaerae]
MLELQDVCFTIKKDGESINLVDLVNIRIPRGHFMAIVGPSGCGKTTLLKTIAGLNPESSGGLYWEGRNLSVEGDLEASDIGYVPQFSIAYDPLTVDESVEAATKLRVAVRDNEELDHRIDRVLEETGLAAIADRQVKVLSGGQKRRLGLAMELVSDPKLLLCDEVTSGLDPRSEREIVRLLHDLSRREGRIVLSVTHSLAHLELYDSILVLHEGRVAYHGPPDQVTHYFSVHDTEEVYPKLATQTSERWQSSWMKHRAPYYSKLDKVRTKLIDSGALHLPLGVVNQPVSTSSQGESAPAAEVGTTVLEKVAPLTSPAEETPKVRTPGFMTQFMTLLSRRWRIFFRDRGQVFLQLAILLCFPILVTLFSENANGQIANLSDTRQGNIVAEIAEQQTVKRDQVTVGSAISGIIMFQVILLSLMGSNNSAREIAGERQIFEKEKFGGLRPSAYLASKVAFLACLVLAQSLWMGVFVNLFAPFRGGGGGFESHIIFLLLINGAMTAICLGISALMRTAEQASLLSIYLVGFQLPLSGAVLALPDSVEFFTQKFISAYWAWSGSVSALEPKVLHAVKSVIDTGLAERAECLYMLAFHVAAGLIAAWIGARRHQWD